MKRNLILIVIVFSLLALAGCDIFETEHTHEFGEWTVEKEASCTEDGRKIRSCSCTETEEEILPATGHTYKYTENTDENGNITAMLICQGENCESLLTNTAGLYNAENILVASWDELTTVYGLDIEKDYNEKNHSSEKNHINYIIKNNDNLKESVKMIVADSVSKIGNYAFYNCSSLIEIKIPTSVNQIGNYAFYYCSNLFYEGTSKEWQAIGTSSAFVSTNTIVRYDDKVEFYIKTFIKDIGSAVGYHRKSVVVEGDNIFINNVLYNSETYTQKLDINYIDLFIIPELRLDDAEEEELKALLNVIKESDCWLLNSNDTDAYVKQIAVCNIDNSYYFLILENDQQNDNYFSVSISNVFKINVPWR